MTENEDKDAEHSGGQPSQTELNTTETIPDDRSKDLNAATNGGKKGGRGKGYGACWHCGGQPVNLVPDDWCC